MNYRLLIIIELTILGVSAPHSAHAFFGSGSLGAFVDAPLAVLLAVLMAINGLLGSFLVALQSGIQWVLGLELTTNLPVLRSIWVILRDLCNLGFIVLLTAVALSYILSILPALKRYASSTVIINILIAALLINFSFAIGQVIVFFGNTLTKITLNALPKEDLTAILLQSLAPVSVANANALNAAPAQPLTKEDARAKMLASITAAENLRYQECLKEFDPTAPLPKNESVVRTTSRALETTVNYLFRDSETCVQEILNARSGVKQTGWLATISEAVNSLSKSSTEILISLLGGEALKLFISLSLFLCFLSMGLFLFIRIGAIWILLASAPLFWFSIALPGNNQVGQWLNQVKGWSLFAPIYFFFLTPGLLFLGSRGEMIASITQGGTQWPFGFAALQSIIFYVFVVAVFSAVTAYSYKIAFAGLGGSDSITGGLAGFAKKTTFSLDQAMKTVYSGANTAGKAAYANTLKNTVDGTVAAISKRIGQTTDTIAQSLRNQYNLKSSQEIENTLGRKIGVRGADQKEGGEGGDIAKRIKTRREQLETDNESALNAILNPTDRKTEEDRQIAVLRTKLTSSDAYEALAAGELLFKKKKLGVAELKQMRDRYATFSPVAAKTFQDRMHKTIVDEMSGREFKDGISPTTGLPRTAAEFAREEYREIMELLIEDGNGKAAGEFYKKIKNGKQQIAAIQAAVAAQKAGPGGMPVSAELLKDDKGNAITDAYDGYVLESENFSGKEWQEVEELHPGDTGKLGEALDNFLSDAKNVGDLLRTTRGVGQNVRILNRTRNAAKLTDNYKKLERNLQRATDDLADANASGVAKDVSKATKTRDRAQQDIKDFEDRFRATIKRVSQQKKKQV